MGELIKTNALAYISVAVFVGIIVSLFICGIHEKTNHIKSQIIRSVLRFGINASLVCLWVVFFIYKNLYPVTLAYYEYTHNLASEKNGIIESIECKQKDRIQITIDNVEYTIVHSSTDPVVIIGEDIDSGDDVIIRFGEKSKFIFDIKPSSYNTAGQ